MTLSFLARTSCSVNDRVDGYWRHHDIPISRCNVTGVSISDAVETPINCRVNRFRQMGELWTLFEFACSLYLTCNMVLEMTGSISRVLSCIMIFSILRLYGIKFSIN